MSEQSPTLEQILRRKMEKAADIFVLLPATVDRFDADLQCVDATPVILIDRETESGEIVRDRLPTVVRAPVVYPGSDEFRITFPIAVGSVVMLQFTTANLSRWLAKGGVSETQDGRRHQLCSAVATPGGHSFVGSTKPKTTAPKDAMVLHAPKLKLGGPAAAQAGLKGTAYRAAEDALIAAETTFLTALGTYAEALAGLPGMTTPGGIFASALAVYTTARSNYASAVAGANSLSEVVKLV